MFADKFAGHDAQPGSVSLMGAPILVDQDDFEGIHIAARILSQDFVRVTDEKTNPFVHQAPEGPTTAIIIGSIAQSSIIQRLVDENKVDVSAIKGQWECYVTRLIDSPLPGYSKALVIAGSDKRGTIFGIYTLSHQIGMSPFHFWSDVPVQKHKELYALETATRDGPPSVKFRGIFINDETPCLTGWVLEKFGPKYNSEFYKNVFELLLRLKANFLWPAMWLNPGQSFFHDDPLNQKTADAYGIVVSTSHHEPMQRAMNEWFGEPYNQPEGTWSWYKSRDLIKQFFREGAERAKPYESVLTLALRGKGDQKIDSGDITATLTDVISTQRSIIKDVYGSETGENQVLALYKEVLTQYEQGLKVPDDITLLFSDDNQGSIRRLPSGDEKLRSGRAGLYYHFEFVGHPRSYKWLNSNSLSKAWHQLDEAYNNGVDRIWVFNVGDIKPMEVPMSFAMSKAWNNSALAPEQLPQMFDAFVKTNFPGFDALLAQECSQLLFEYDQLMGLGKHECIEDNTFSVLYYDEADTILRKWNRLLERATRVYDVVRGEQLKASVYQLFLHPVKASHIYISLRVALGKNKLYAQQRRTIANKYAAEVLRLFDADLDLADEYHALLGGRWNHMMDQPHYGNRWDQDIAPFRDMVPGLCYVQTRQKASPLVGSMGVLVEGSPGYRFGGVCCEEHELTQPSRGDRVSAVTTPPLETLGPASRWFELYSHSTEPFRWAAAVQSAAIGDWLTLSAEAGDLGTEDPAARIHVSVDWRRVPDGFNDNVLIDVRNSLGDYEIVHVPVKKRPPPPAGFVGFVESSRCVSIHARGFDKTGSAAAEAAAKQYIIHPWIGRTGAGGVLLGSPPAVDASSLSLTPPLLYPFFTYTPQVGAEVTLYFTMTFNTDPKNPLRYEYALDNDEFSTYRLVPDAPAPGEMPPGDLPAGWMEECPRLVWTRKHPVDLSKTGAHNLKVRLRNTNMMLEKVVIDLGGVLESYLGPPESSFVQ